MAQSSHNNTTWGFNRVPLPVDNIAPGQSTTFTFNVTAPNAPGSYPFQWGMQREGYGSFGPGTNVAMINVVAPPPLVNNAEVVGISVPARMQTQLNYNVAVTMRNNGTTTWTQGALHRLGSQNPHDNQIWGAGRIELTSAVAPGQQYTFNFQVKAPAPGEYQMQWGMVQDGVQWFGAAACSQVVVTEDLSRVTFIHTDGLGSPVARTDGAGTVLSRTHYEPYGYVAAGTVPTIGFTGHVNDADTGLTYMQQRYYDPVAGRFLSVDPVVTEANTGESFNRYTYANNSPYKYIDPDGRSSCVDKECKTSTIDSTIPRSDGGTTKITFINDNPNGASPNRPLETKTANVIEAVISVANVDSVNINSTTGGAHAATSHHGAGRAVDMDRVDGKTVNSANEGAGRIQESAQANPNTRENFGPRIMEKTNSTGAHQRPFGTVKLKNAHKTHIHISVQR